MKEPTAKEAQATLSEMTKMCSNIYVLGQQLNLGPRELAGILEIFLYPHWKALGERLNGSRFDREAIEHELFNLVVEKLQARGVLIELNTDNHMDGEPPMTS